MQHDVRIGDTVTIRCEVVPTTEGSTRNLYPGILVNKGGVKVTLPGLDIVSVEHKIRVGDVVTDNTQIGDVIAIHDNYAWVKTAHYDHPVIWTLKTLKRHKDASQNRAQ
jgi:hypothetical protein